MELTAVLTPAEEGGYVALNPETPETGTTTQGETIEAAIANLQEATTRYLSAFSVATPGHPLITTFVKSKRAHGQASCVARYRLTHALRRCKSDIHPSQQRGKD